MPVIVTEPPAVTLTISLTPSLVKPVPLPVPVIVTVPPALTAPLPWILTPYPSFERCRCQSRRW